MARERFEFRFIHLLFGEIAFLSCPPRVTTKKMGFFVFFFFLGSASDHGPRTHYHYFYYLPTTTTTTTTTTTIIIPLFTMRQESVKRNVSIITGTGVFFLSFFFLKKKKFLGLRSECKITNGF